MAQVLITIGITDLSTSARYNPAFGRDDNGASFNHNWYNALNDKQNCKNC